MISPIKRRWKLKNKRNQKKKLKIKISRIRIRIRTKIKTIIIHPHQIQLHYLPNYHNQNPKPWTQNQQMHLLLTWKSTVIHPQRMRISILSPPIQHQHQHQYHQHQHSQTPDHSNMRNFHRHKIWLNLNH